MENEERYGRLVRLLYPLPLKLGIRVKYNELSACVYLVLVGDVKMDSSEALDMVLDLHSEGQEPQHTWITKSDQPSSLVFHIFPWQCN